MSKEGTHPRTSLIFPKKKKGNFSSISIRGEEGKRELKKGLTTESSYKQRFSEGGRNLAYNQQKSKTEKEKKVSVSGGHRQRKSTKEKKNSSHLWISGGGKWAQ